MQITCLFVVSSGRIIFIPGGFKVKKKATLLEGESVNKTRLSFLGMFSLSVTWVFVLFQVEVPVKTWLKFLFLGSTKKPQFLLHFWIEACAFFPYYQQNCVQRTVPSPDFAKELIST